MARSPNAELSIVVTGYFHSQVGLYKYLLVAEGIAGADRLLQLLGANALILLVQPWAVEEFWQVITSLSHMVIGSQSSIVITSLARRTNSFRTSTMFRSTRALAI